jgi:tRNA(Ile)-lysidine synthase
VKPGRGVVAVAVSGGRDSTALLHATARWAREHAGMQVLALHVHHGLMPQADDWWTHVQAQCRRWRLNGLPVQFQGTRLASRPQPGDSVEAWARRERYHALGSMARAAGASCVLLAHHRRDQAETFLLQALRGAGPRGQASMPAAVQRDGLWWFRPWLKQPVEDIEAYVRRHRLKVVVDPSNQDSRFARSKLRAHVWPVLLQAFPDVQLSLSAAARRAQEALAVVAEVAAQDLQACSDSAGRLLSAEWSLLSVPRQAWVLRAWLQAQLGRGAPESLIERLATEWPHSGAGHRWAAPGGWVHSARGALLWQAQAAAEAVQASETSAALGAEPITRLNLSRPGSYQAPGWNGRWKVDFTDGPGIEAQRLRDAELRSRQGAERFQLHARGLPRSLKKQFQTLDVAALERVGPLLYADDQLVFVPGLGIDARCLVSDGGPRVTIAWVPDTIGLPTRHC